MLGRASVDPGIPAHVIERSTPVSTRENARPDFEEFVVVCSGRLLRTAYLLTRDPGLAEDLLQSALAETWFAWHRLEDQPEPAVRMRLANAYATGWRRTGSERSGPAGGSETAPDLWSALGHLPRRQRTAVVLRFFDDLSETDTAEILRCSVGTVTSRTSRALDRLHLDPGLRDVDELRRTLHERAEEVEEGVGVHARIAAVSRRVRATQGRRRGVIGAAVGVAALAVVAGVVVVLPMLPDRAPPPSGIDEPMVLTPPRLAGWEMPDTLQVRRATYRYLRGEQTQDDRDLLRVAVSTLPHAQVIGWSTTPGTPGEVVVSVDGDEVSRSAAGTFEYGPLLVPDSPHLVVVRVTQPRPGNRIGLAVFEYDRPQ